MDPYVTDLIGAELGSRYRLDSILGAGGMGAVFSANDLLLSRQVALKTPHPKLADQGDYLALLVQEARLLAQLSDSHFFPNIYDLVLPQGDDIPFLVMEHLRGKTIWAIIRHNAQPPASSWCLEVASQIARSLMILHERGIVHQDIKPRNVFLASGGGGSDFVKVLDFGVSVTKKRLRSASIDSSSLIAGTLVYMAPEVKSGGKVGEEADIYSFGVLLLELIASEYPFRSIAHESFLRDRAADPLSISSDPRSERMPQSFWSLVGRMLSEDPSRRPLAEECAEGIRKASSDWL